MFDKRVIKEIERHCWKIRENGKHYVCYPKHSNKIVVVSKTPSDNNFRSILRQDFRRLGIIINL